MPTYAHEASDPERFQQMVQALLLKDYPNLQCFPVAQPDGGRDGSATLPAAAGKTILQVKFKRVDEEVDDVAAWMIAALEKEKPKIEELIQRGATEYLMVTNARGSAHLDVGSMDQVQVWLNSNLDISGQCYWRADIDRRLEASLALQWHYPEFLTGTDGIRLALEHVGGGEDAQRRLAAVKSFVTYQYGQDAKVKFKQVDLKNDLLSLFVDVPAAPSERFAKHIVGLRMEAYRNLYGKYGLSRPEYFDFDDDALATLHQDASSGYRFQQRGLGTATLLLDEGFQTHFPRVVLEGAPGQGKSTLAQYVCQVHRARYLSKSEMLTALPSEHQVAPMRLPIKVDLRDLATWLGRRDPFVPGQPVVEGPWEPTLASFLGRLVTSQSGGISFTAYDVARLLQRAPTLLFLDGLDEVAEVDTRKRLIEAIRHGLQGLEANEADLQVVVTSRPAAFANSPGLSPREFTYLDLLNIPTSMAREYMERWIVARDLDASDAKDVRSIFAEKMSLPHIRDLARNPMQLAILLSLIHSIGFSLPDERTELYSSYMDRFLTREAEKSAVVRKHRLLLVKIHQHLAWVLQSQAEIGGGVSGSVTAEQLRRMIQEYLVAHEHKVDILEDLFTGMLERVYVLVQRIEGAYEFEVQPIREFFCAKHLYDTAAAGATSESGSGGTKNDRFDAIARNAYWTNVARFYAGCYTSGELGGLYLQLEDLVEGVASGLSLRPRHLGCMLLGDWVFRGNPRATRHVVQTVIDDLGLRAATWGFARNNVGGRALALNEECGRSDLCEKVLVKLDAGAKGPAARSLALLLEANMHGDVRQQLLARIDAHGATTRSWWISIASRAGALEDLDGDQLHNVIFADVPEPPEVEDRVMALMMRLPEQVERVPKAIEIATELALTGTVTAGGYSVGPQSWLSQLTHWLNVDYAGMRATSRFYYEEEQIQATRRQAPAEPANVTVFLAETSSLHRCPPQIWQSQLEPWRTLVGAALEAFGDSWATYGLANVAAGIKSSSERAAGASRLFDSATDLCSRARYARLRRGGGAWWLEQLEAVQTPLQSMFWALLVTSWVSVRQLEELHHPLNRVLEGLTEQQYHQLFLSSAGAAPALVKSSAKAGRVSVDGLSARSLGLLHSRWTELRAPQIRDMKDSADPDIRRTAESAELLALLRTDAWSADELRHLRRYYELVGRSPQHARPILQNWSSLPLSRRILEEPFLYPKEFLVAAGRVLEREEGTTAVLTAATTGSWSFE